MFPFTHGPGRLVRSFADAAAEVVESRREICKSALDGWRVCGNTRHSHRVGPGRGGHRWDVERPLELGANSESWHVVKHNGRTYICKGKISSFFDQHLERPGSLSP